MADTMQEETRGDTFTALSCERFVEQLASSAPVPGGGGASALVGAIGCALGAMVGSLTAGKPKYAYVADEVASLLERADALQQRLLELVGRDAEAFAPLSAAYGLAAQTDEQRAHKERVMESCLKDACDVPLAIMQATCEAIELCEGFARTGSKLALSDAGCGAIVCKAALQAASLNVFVNTKLMHERDHAGACEARAHALLDEYCPRADAVFSDVRERVS